MVLGENRVVWPGNAANGQLFHVEQFEIACKHAGSDGSGDGGEGVFYGRIDCFYGELLGDIFARMGWAKCPRLPGEWVGSG